MRDGSFVGLHLEQSIRDPISGFQAWAARYVDAILRRQQHGPYYLAAYSSAGAFGYEVARQLRALGHEVALLALIDPLALDRATKSRFGYWALEARFMRRHSVMLVLLAGWLRRAIPGWIRDRGTTGRSNDWTLSSDQFLQSAQATRRNCGHIRNLSALLQLNTGLPFALTDADLASAGPDGCLGVLLERVRQVAPETDLETIENIVVQYELQVRAQHNYHLARYDGNVVLFEPESRHRGLLSAQLRPYVLNLREWSFKVSSVDQEQTLVDGFPAAIRTHYLCILARVAGEPDGNERRESVCVRPHAVEQQRAALAIHRREARILTHVLGQLIEELLHDRLELVRFEEKRAVETRMCLGNRAMPAPMLRNGRSVYACVVN